MLKCRFFACAGKLPLLQESLCRSGLQIEFTCRYGTDDLLKALQEAAEGWSGREDTYRVSFCNSGQRQHVSSIAVFPVQLEGERHEGTPSTCHFMEYFEIAGISVIFVKAPNGEGKFYFHYIISLVDGQDSEHIFSH